MTGLKSRLIFYLLLINPAKTATTLPSGEWRTAGLNNSLELPTDDYCNDHTEALVTTDNYETTPNTAAQGNRETEFYRQLANEIFKYGGPIVAGIGFICNLLSFVVMTSPGMSGSTTSCYLATLAVADTLALLMMLLVVWYPRMTSPLVFFTGSHWLYQYLNAGRKFSMLLSAWTVVCVSVERFLVTWFPFKGPMFCTLRTARITVVIVAFLALVYSGLSHIWNINWLFASLYSFIPIGCLVLFSSATALKLTCKGCKAGNGISVETDISEKRARKATRTVLAVAVFYVGFTLFGAVFLSIRRALVDRGIRQPDYFMVVTVVDYLLIMANNACNFFPYVLVSNRFRSALLKIICPCRAQTPPVPPVNDIPLEPMTNGGQHVPE